MLTARSPVRIDFAGGTTDISPFCDEEGGCVINAAINVLTDLALQIVKGNTKLVDVIILLDISESMKNDAESLASNLENMFNLFRSTAKDYEFHLVESRWTNIYMAFFKSSSFYDKFEKVRKERILRPVFLLNETFNLIQNVLMLLTILGLLLRFHWLVVCVLLMTSSPNLYIQLT